MEIILFWMAGWPTVIIMLLSPAGAWAWAELGKKHDTRANKRVKNKQFSDRPGHTHRNMRSKHTCIYPWFAHLSYLKFLTSKRSKSPLQRNLQNDMQINWAEYLKRRLGVGNFQNVQFGFR